MNTKLEVVRLTNEDVITTSALCSFTPGTGTALGNGSYKYMGIYDNNYLFDNPLNSDPEWDIGVEKGHGTLYNENGELIGSLDGTLKPVQGAYYHIVDMGSDSFAVWKCGDSSHHGDPISFD